MATTTILARGDYTQGSREFTPVTVTQTSGFAVVSVIRDGWLSTGSTVIKVFVDVSLDGGTNWIAPYCGFGTRGGVHIKKDLTIGSISSISFPMPPQRSVTRRQIRVRINMIESLRTEIELETR